MMDRIEALENDGLVIINVAYPDGTVVPMEYAENPGFVRVEVVDLDEYEANGFEADGLSGRWIEL